MAKLPRKTLKLFAGSASNNGQFGSAQAGAPLTDSDPSTLQALAAWAQGWVDAVIGGQKLPPLEEFQAVQYVHSYSTAYLFQEGMPEYDVGTTYFINSIVKKAGTYQLYGSVTDNNVGNALTDPTKWTLLIDLSSSVQSTPVGAVIPFAGSAAPSLWLLCAGQAVSRSAYAALFAVISTTFGVGNGTTTFNVPDLRGRIAVGADNMGGSAANRVTSDTMAPDGQTIGAVGGLQEVTLTTPQLPSHVHNVAQFSTGVVSPGSGSLHLDAREGDTTQDTSATGGGAAHDNMQPSIILNQIIYAGV